jgi:GT2 family glycosyltransferase
VIVPTAGLSRTDAARRRARLERCLDGLASQPPHQLLVVEDGDSPASDLGTWLSRRAAGAWHVALPAAAGFAGAVSEGLERARLEGAEWILLLNDDVWLEPGCLQALLEDAAADPGLGVLAPLLVAEDGATTAGIELNWLGQGRDRAAPESERSAADGAIAVSGAVLLARPAALAAWDRGWGFYYEDVDACLAARDQGLGIRVVQRARARHQGSASLGRGSSRQAFYLARNQLRLVLKTFPLPALWASAPLCLGRLALRPWTSLARGELAQASGELAALASLPWLLARASRTRRPMHPETFARVTPRLWW